MQFTTNYSPSTPVFSLMSEDELREFYNWFMNNLPYCIEELMQLVRSTPSLDGWPADYSSQSLDTLGEWFSTKVQKRDLTPEERNFVENKRSPSMEIPDKLLTDETKSLIIYIGMYYGQVAITNNLGIKWEQSLENRKFADFGQPVVTGPGAKPINPVRVASSFAHGLADGRKSGADLRKAYEYWVGLRKS